MNFVANFIRFPAVKKFENRLRFDKVTEFKGGNFFETQCSSINLLGGRSLKFDIMLTKRAFYSACNSIFMCGTAADKLVL